MPCIELADVGAPELLHHGRDGAGRGRRDQKVDVVVHEHVGVQCAAGGEQRLAEQVQVAVAVVVIQKAGQAVVAALDDMLGNAREVESGLPGHASRFVRAARAAVASAAAPRCRRHSRSSVRK